MSKTQTLDIQQNTYHILTNTGKWLNAFASINQSANNGKAFLEGNSALSLALVNPSLTRSILSALAQDFVVRGVERPKLLQLLEQITTNVKEAAKIEAKKDPTASKAQSFIDIYAGTVATLVGGIDIRPKFINDMINSLVDVSEEDYIMSGIGKRINTHIL